MEEFIQNWKPLVYNLGIVIGAGLLGLLLHFIVFRILTRVSKKVTLLDVSILKHVRGPTRYMAILLGINLTLPLIPLSGSIRYINDTIFHSLFIASVAWLIISLMAVGEYVISSHYDINIRDNLRARKIHTQTRIVRKMLAVVIIILAAGLILMGFDSFRQLGTGILASAGLATLVIGLAAQKIFGNFLAGIQIAFTQPIRVDDVVVVENEWGKIEEISLTYVIVCLWDLRRLVLPISYFIEKPFQNWTKTTADLLGTVFIYTDYTVPVQKIREELERILKVSDKWDGKVSGLQVTDSKANTLELRALMSSCDSSILWDLRCEVREKLIEYIQKNYPTALPKTRAEFSQTVSGKRE